MEDGRGWDKRETGSSTRGNGEKMLERWVGAGIRMGEGRKKPHRRYAGEVTDDGDGDRRCLVQGYYIGATWKALVPATGGWGLLISGRALAVVAAGRPPTRERRN